MYEVRAGDTFAAISRRLYGTESNADILAAANPGVFEPLIVGVSIITPPDPNAIETTPQKGSADNPEEVAVLIAGERFRFWSDITLGHSLDGLSVVSFRAPFEPKNQAFREIFRPFSFQPVQVTIGGESVFTGTMLTPAPDLAAESRTVEVSCYSLPGVLQDCTASAAGYPLEYNNMDLQQIVNTVLRPFGLSAVFEADPGPAFEKVALDPAGRIWPFIVKLAQQRNLILSNNERGQLLVRQSVAPGQPVAVLEQGAPPLEGVAVDFNPQEYYSHVTGLRAPGATTGDGAQYTAKNERLESAVRPLTFKAGDTAGGDLETATRAALGRMVANSVAYSVQVPTWRGPLGGLWRPNTTIQLTAPGVMVYNPYEFIIRSVTFSRGADSEQAELALVLPGVFSGEIPEVMPWD